MQWKLFNTCCAYCYTCWSKVTSLFERRLTTRKATMTPAYSGGMYPWKSSINHARNGCHRKQAAPELDSLLTCTPCVGTRAWRNTQCGKWRDAGTNTVRTSSYMNTLTLYSNGWNWTKWSTFAYAGLLRAASLKAFRSVYVCVCGL